MTKLRRTLITSLALIGATLSTPAQAITQSATVQVNVNRPLTLTALQNLNLGTLTLAGGTWSNVTVGVSRAGVLTCGNTNVVCSGATAVARYKVTGSNK